MKVIGSPLVINWIKNHPRSLFTIEAQLKYFWGGENSLNAMSAGAGLRERRQISTLRLHLPHTAAFYNVRFDPLRRREAPDYAPLKKY